MPLLEVKNLGISVSRYVSRFRRQDVPIIEGLDLAIESGQITAVIGASGSGKSLLAHAILGLLPNQVRMSGEIIFKGAVLDGKRLSSLRGREIVLIPQSVTHLDPTMPVGRQVRYAARLQSRRESADGHKRDDGQSRIQARKLRQNVLRLQRHVFARYGLSPDVGKMYPFELSGGMARRVLNSAAAVREGAKLIIADEPTPGMTEQDVREALDILKSMADTGSGVLLITHDIEAALTVADRVVVFYAGMAVETAHKDDFSNDGEGLRHPYTKALWRALPQNGFQPLGGIQPQPGEKKPGCSFAPRCPMATDVCRNEKPDARIVRDGLVRCIHAT